MKITSIFSGLAFIIVFFFALAGLFLTGNVLHELSHKQDFRGLVYDDAICGLILPNNFSLKSMFSEDVVDSAFYSYKPNSSYTEEIEEVGTWTEKKAYFINLILVFLFLACYVIIMNEWSKKGRDKTE